MKIINPRPLVDDYPFPEIVDRKEEQKTLVISFIKPLLEGKQPSGFYYITGGSGSGKTFVITRLIDDNYKEIKKKLPRFEYIYINVAQEGIPSYTEFYTRVNAQLRTYLPVIDATGKIIDEIKAWNSRTTVTNLFTSIIEQKQLNVLLVIDEVEKILETPKGDNLFYSLSDLHNKFTGKPYGVFVIFITNDKTLANRIVDKIDSRMSLYENFSNYAVNDLFEILKIAGKYSLDKIDDMQLLQEVAREIADTSCSARDVKRLLHNRINQGCMDKAIVQLDKDSLKDDLLHLNPQQRIALQAVLLASEDFNRMLKKNIPAKYKDRFVTTQRANKFYETICEHSTELIKARSYRTFIRMLDGLSDLGIISYNRVSKGRGGGWAGKIEILSGTDFIKDTLLDLIEKDRQEAILESELVLPGASGMGSGSGVGLGGGARSGMGHLVKIGDPIVIGGDPKQKQLHEQ